MTVLYGAGHVVLNPAHVGCNLALQVWINVCTTLVSWKCFTFDDVKMPGGSSSGVALKLYLTWIYSQIATLWFAGTAGPGARCDRRHSRALRVLPETGSQRLRAGGFRGTQQRAAHGDLCRAWQAQWRRVASRSKSA